MPRRMKEGYWFDTKSYELKEVYDHYLFLSELESKVRSELDPGKDGRRWAKSLGMEPGQGWGIVPREPPAQRKVRFMFNAFKAGWVRIRAHSDMPMLVMEFWRKTDDMMASLALALKKMGIPEGERVELHEVEKDNPWTVYAGDLYKVIAPAEELSVEEKGRLGFSVYENPPRSRVIMVPQGAKLKPQPKFVQLGGPWKHPETGKWWPTENPVIYGPMSRLNPEAQQKFVDPEAGIGKGESSARLFLGLKRGYGDRVGQDIKMDEVVQFVKQFRLKQLGDAPGGASFILQRGYFTEYLGDKPYIHPDEDSVQILIYPDGPELEKKVIAKQDWWLVVKKKLPSGQFEPVYEDHMNELSLALVKEFEQKVVILHLIVDGELKFLGQAYHTE